MDTNNYSPKGNSVDYLISKRQRILEELQSEEHYSQTETLAYGDHDPMDVPLVLCEHCDSAGLMSRASPEAQKTRWIVVCQGCGTSTSPPLKRPWQAALQWNSIHLASQDYRDLPLFGLSSLAPAAAKERMRGVRHNLELRKNLAGIELTLSARTDIRPPGKLYQQRLDAYLKWAMLAQRLIKLALKSEENRGDQ